MRLKRWLNRSVENDLHSIRFDHVNYVDLRLASNRLANNSFYLPRSLLRFSSNPYKCKLSPSSKATAPASPTFIYNNIYKNKIDPSSNRIRQVGVNQVINHQEVSRFWGFLIFILFDLSFVTNDSNYIISPIGRNSAVEIARFFSPLSFHQLITR